MDFEQKFDAFTKDQSDRHTEVCERLSVIETTLTGKPGVTTTLESFGERLASLETHRTYAKGVLGTLAFLWTATLAWWKFGWPR